MSTMLFRRLIEGFMSYDDYSVCNEDAIDKVSFSSYQKCISAIMILAYGIAADLVYGYV